MTDENEFDAQFEAELEAMKEDGSINHIDENGMIQFNMQKLEILHPALYHAVWEDMCREIDASIRDLVDEGLIEMSFRAKDDGGLEEIYMLTDAGRAVAEEMARDNEIFGDLTDLG